MQDIIFNVRIRNHFERQYNNEKIRYDIVKNAMQYIMSAKNKITEQE